MTFRIITFFCCCLFISTTLFSQKKELKVAVNEKVVGKNLIDNSDIKGVEYLFSERIHEFFVDTATSYLTVQLRGYNFDGTKLKKKGNIIQYDLKNEKILWKKAIDYEICELLQFGELLIFNEYNDAYGIDKNTGEILWAVKNYLYFANPKYNVGIAYMYNIVAGLYTNELLGFDLLKGKLIWRRNISREFGWNDYFYLNDSTLLVAAAGLHAINIKTGEGWDYNTITGKNLHANPESAEVAGAIIGGIIGGLIGGLLGGYIAPVIYTNYDALKTGNNIIREVASNALVDKSFIYFASRDSLVMLNKNTGEIAWKYPFENNLASKSSLFIDNNSLYMINSGFAIRGIKQLDFGKPFIAAFDAQTGKQKYLFLLNKANGYIIDYKLIGDDLYLLFQKAIGQYDLKTGTLLSEKPFPKNKNRDYSFLDESLFYVSNPHGIFESLDQNEQIKTHIYSHKDRVFAIDNLLNISQTIEYKNINKLFFNYKDYNLIVNDNKIFIINNNGIKLAEINISSNAIIIDDILYDKQGKSLIVIDLGNIFNK